MATEVDAGIGARFSAWVPVSVLELLRDLRGPSLRNVRASPGAHRRSSACGGSRRGSGCGPGGLYRRYSSVCPHEVRRAVSQLIEPRSDSPRSDFGLDYDPEKAQAFVPEPLWRSPAQSGSELFDEPMLPSPELAPSWAEIRAQSCLGGDLLRHGLPLHEVVRARERFLELWTVYTVCTHPRESTPAWLSGPKKGLAAPEYNI